MALALLVRIVLALLWFSACPSLALSTQEKFHFTETFNLNADNVAELLKGQHDLPPDLINNALTGVQAGNRDALYFVGLLSLYGIGISQDSKRAVQYLRRAAEHDLPDAQTALAVLLYYGQSGVSADPRSAMSYFRSAAVSGHVDAMWMLGRCYYEGRGTDVNYAEAVNWFEKAAAKGSGMAHHYLGVLHEYGYGVVKDTRQAIKWHELAAQGGIAASNYHLGLMKAYGRGFSQDFSGAAVRFQQAANAKHAPSMLYLGKMCLYGHGFPPDYDLALMWFEKAAEAGDPAVYGEAATARDELARALKAANEANAAVVAMYDYGTPGVPRKSE